MRLFRSGVVVSAMTFISRIFGFVRDMVIAHGFGAGMAADAFFVAFKIPNFLRRLFAEGAFCQAFVPVLSEYKTHRSPEEIKLLLDRVTGTLSAVLGAMTVFGILAAPLIITVFAPGFVATQDKFALTVDMFHLTFPYLLFISLTALAGGVLNTYGRFAVPAFTPVFLNLSMIGATLWLAPRMEQPVMALAWGVFIAGVVQLLFQFPFLIRLRLCPWPRIKSDDPGVRQILRLMGPAIFGVSVTQISLLIDTIIASFLVTGSVSWLYYSDRLVEFPLGVFSIAFATVILPSLSQQHAQGSLKQFSSTLDWALRWIVLIATPAAVGLALLAEPLLCTLFQYGEFSAHDVVMAGRSLAAYSFGLLGFSLVKVLAPGYFARQDTRTPVRIGVIAMLSNIVLNLILVFPLQHAGLALATSLSAFLNAALLYRGLREKEIYQPASGWRSLLLQVAVATTLMAGLLFFGVAELEQWLSWGMMSRGWHLGVWLVGAAIVYLGALTLAGLRWKKLLSVGAEAEAERKSMG
ncbi:MAG: murein biosynthesis integral membrane protein MurJ [Gammaproteobacteria bacterium]